MRPSSENECYLDKNCTVCLTRVFIIAKNCVFYTKKIIWDAKVEMPCVTRRRRSIGNTYHYHVKSTLDSFGMDAS